MTRPSTPFLRFRIFVGRKLQDETWVNVTSPPAEIREIQAKHVTLVIQAQILGLPWLVEVYDPDLPEPYAYARYGTDTRGMTDPTEIRPGADGAEDIAVLILGGQFHTSRRPRSFTCPQCGRTTRNPNDIAAGYCGNCHEWTGRPGGTIQTRGRTVNVDDAFANLADHYDDTAIENLTLPEPEAGQC